MGDEMTISPPIVSNTQGGFRITARIESSKGPNGELWFEIEDEPRCPLPEMATTAFLAACLPVAGWIGEELEILSPCEPRSLASAKTFARAFARLHHRPAISVKGEPAPTGGFEPRGVAASFSGGIDSFYTLIHHPEIDVLVTGLGFELMPDDPNRLETIRSWTRDVGAVMGKRCVFIRSNFRQLFDPHAPWYEATHGALLTAYAFLLSSAIGTYLIPSSASIDQLVPTGSHALLDAAWAKGPTEIVNDGWDRTRNDKLQAIGSHPLVRRTLRVCAKPTAERNCGRCFKCVKTLLAIHVYGVPVPETFPHPLTRKMIRRLRIKSWRDVSRFRTLQDHARRNPESAWIARPLGVAIFLGRCRRVRYGVARRLSGRT